MNFFLGSESAFCLARFKIILTEVVIFVLRNPVVGIVKKLVLWNLDFGIIRS